MLDKFKAEEIMRPVPVELSPEDPAHLVKQLMDEHNACHLPVTVNSQLLGIVSRVEAVAAHLFNGPGYLVTLDFMSTNVFKAYPEASLRELTELLLKRRDSCIAVVSKCDEVLGLVHAQDILRRVMHYHQSKKGNFQLAWAA